MGNSSGKVIKKTLKEIPEVLPHNDLNNVDINFEKLIDMVVVNDENEKKKYKDNRFLDTEKLIVQLQDNEVSKNINNNEGTKNNDTLTKEYEDVFSENERNYLKKMFLTYSSDGIMSNRQFWSFLDLEFIYNTTFAKYFYITACEFNENTKLDYLKFMDYQKFIQFVAIFTKLISEKFNMREMRLKFIYKLFERDNSEEVDRLEFRNLTTAFVEMILNIKFDSDLVMEKIDLLNKESNNLTLMDKALDQYVDEVFNTFSYSGEILTFEEWSKWFYSINGIEKFLDYIGYLKL